MIYFYYLIDYNHYYVMEINEFDTNMIYMLWMDDIMGIVDGENWSF